MRITPVFTRFLGCMLAASLLLSACNLPVAPKGTVMPTPANFKTAAVRTIQAMQTENAATQQSAATDTPVPGVTQTVTITPGGPSVTPTSQPCEQASFVADVTIPDGTPMLPGQAFTKTWRLKNIGTCAWNNTYSLAFVNGDPMGAQASVKLPGDVPPGATADLSIDFKAPNTPGKYRGNWKLRNPAGVLFGVESDAPFYVVIQSAPPTATASITPPVTATPLATAVPPAAPTQKPTATVTPAAEGVLYDFTAAACQAEWRSAAGVLPCPGKNTDANGAVLSLVKPKLQTGDTEIHAVLETLPQNVDNGAITGAYPAQTIHTGDHFRVTLSCLSDAAACKVKYQLNYREGNGEPQNLGQWSQTGSGGTQNINIDLSPLNGKSVQIILVVLADGAASPQNKAVWVFPRLTKE